MPPKKRAGRQIAGTNAKRRKGNEQDEDEAELQALLKEYNSDSEPFSSSESDDGKSDIDDLFRPDRKPAADTAGGASAAAPAPTSVFQAKATDVSLANVPVTHRPPAAVSSNDQVATIRERQITLQSLNLLSQLKSGVVLFYLLDGRDLPGRYGQTLLFAKAYHLQRRRWLSVALRVEGLRREVYIVPKVQTAAAVPQVMQDLLPWFRKVGIDSTTVKARMVRRWYAFEEPGVERGVHSVIKLTWPGTAPPLGIPDTSDCAQFSTISKVFGDGKSPLETLLVKQRLRGPMWVAIPAAALSVVTMPQDKLSWCTAEMIVRTPRGAAADVLNAARMGGVSLTPIEEHSGQVPGYRFVRPVTPQELEAGAVEKVSLTVASLSLVVAETEEKGKMPSNQVYGAVLYVTNGLSPDQAPSRTYSTEEHVWVRPVEDANLNPRKVLPPNLAQSALAKRLVRPKECRNESDLLTSLVLKLMEVDADVMVGHNFLGYDLDILLHRMEALKVPNWSVLGRLQWRQFPKQQRGAGGTGQSTAAEKQVMCGRLVADTYLLSQEHLRENSYRLWSLAASQRLVGPDGQVVSATAAPRDFSAADTLAAMCDGERLAERLVATRTKAFLSMSLCHHIQAIPLTKQLTNLAGNQWSRTLTGSRAERIEYYLLHRFHDAKFILPAKQAYKPFGEGEGKGGKGGKDADGEDGDAQYADAGVGRKREKAKYKGGMVLEPKRGLYSNWVLLLDFNSLYPSIIQEHSICFTTITRGNREEVEAVPQAEEDEDAIPPIPSSEDLVCSECLQLSDSERAKVMCHVPQLPKSCIHRNILPRAIRELIDARKAVKGLIKSLVDEISARGKPSEEQQQRLARLDVQQKAIKLTANSIYGCLGFTASRFYARDIAKMVTYQGRAALQSTVTVVPTVNDRLEVVYGDTDSVMVNTGIPNTGDVSEALARANDVKKAVNGRYRLLEIELDGLFRSILLVRKKKYAAITCVNPSLELPALMDPRNFKQEVKGLDMVRRDWCVLTRTVCKKVLDFVLTGEGETVLDNVAEYLRETARQVRAKEVNLNEFVITKSITRAPQSYKDPEGLPHVAVALRMQKKGDRVAVNDFIPYIICNRVGGAAEGADGEEGGEEGKIKAATAGGSKKLSERAYLKEEVEGDVGLQVDAEWYLACQLLQPVSKLLEHLPEGGCAFVVDALGLNNSKLVKHVGHHGMPGTSSTGVKTDGITLTAVRATVQDPVPPDSALRLVVSCPNTHPGSKYPCGFECDFTYTLADALWEAVNKRVTAGPLANPRPTYNPPMLEEEDLARFEAVRAQFKTKSLFFVCGACRLPIPVAYVCNHATRIARASVAKYLRQFSDGMSTHGMVGLTEAEAATVAEGVPERELRGQLWTLQAPFVLRRAMTLVKGKLELARVERKDVKMAIPREDEIEEYVACVADRDFDWEEMKQIKEASKDVRDRMLALERMWVNVDFLFRGLAPAPPSAGAAVGGSGAVAPPGVVAMVQ